MVFGLLVARGGKGGLGTLLFIIGIIAVVIGRIGAWWHHA
jgi:hypothetical protein